MESQYLLQRRERMLGIKPPEEKKAVKPIPKKSAKMKNDLKEYNKIKKEMLAEDDRCELRSPVCTGTAQGLQHTKRRGINLLNKKYLLRACNACNGWCEDNPVEAVELGMAKSVHKLDVAIAEYDPEINSIIIK